MLLPQAFEAFSAKVADKDAFIADLEAARQDPSSKEARKLLHEISNFVTIAGATVPGSASERQMELPKLIANTRFFGPASMFDSCSPDDVHDARAMRLAFPSQGPGRFPDDASLMLPALRREDHQTSDEHEAAVTRFTEHLGPGTVFPLTELGQQQLATDNPVATALSFEEVKSAFYEDLLCIPPNSTYKTTVSPNVRPKGVHGLGTGFGSVEETNKRASKHFHSLVHGGAHADLLSAILGDAALEKLVYAAMDSVYRAEAPASLHALHAARQALRVRSVRHGFYESPAYPRPAVASATDGDKATAERSRLQYEYSALAVAVTVGTHDHRHRCHAGKMGKQGCSMCRPAGHQVPSTRAVQLYHIGDEVRRDRCLVLPVILSVMIIPSANTPLFDYLLNPSSALSLHFHLTLVCPLSPQEANEADAVQDSEWRCTSCAPTSQDAERKLFVQPYLPDQSAREASAAVVFELKRRCLLDINSVTAADYDMDVDEILSNDATGDILTLVV